MVSLQAPFVASPGQLDPVHPCNPRTNHIAESDTGRTRKIEMEMSASLAASRVKLLERELSEATRRQEELLKVMPHYVRDGCCSPSENTEGAQAENSAGLKLEVAAVRETCDGLKERMEGALVEWRSGWKKLDGRVLGLTKMSQDLENAHRIDIEAVGAEIRKAKTLFEALEEQCRRIPQTLEESRAARALAGENGHRIQELADRDETLSDEIVQVRSYLQGEAESLREVRASMSAVDALQEQVSLVKERVIGLEASSTKVLERSEGGLREVELRVRLSVDELQARLVDLEARTRTLFDQERWAQVTPVLSRLCEESLAHQNAVQGVEARFTELEGAVERLAKRQQKSIVERDVETRLRMIASQEVAAVEQSLSSHVDSVRAELLQVAEHDNEHLLRTVACQEVAAVETSLSKHVDSVRAELLQSIDDVSASCRQAILGCGIRTDGTKAELLSLPLLWMNLEKLQNEVSELRPAEGWTSCERGAQDDTETAQRGEHDPNSNLETDRIDESCLEGPMTETCGPHLQAIQNNSEADHVDSCPVIITDSSSMEAGLSCEELISASRGLLSARCELAERMRNGRSDYGVSVVADRHPQCNSHDSDNVFFKSCASSVRRCGEEPSCHVFRPRAAVLRHRFDEAGLSASLSVETLSTNARGNQVSRRQAPFVPWKPAGPGERRSFPCRPPQSCRPPSADARGCRSVSPGVSAGFRTMSPRRADSVV